MGIIGLALRGFQLLFAIVVFGLSVDIGKELASNQIHTSMNTTAGYTAFTGGLGIIAALVGLLALFWDSLNSIVTLVLDGLAALCFLAGGIAVVSNLHGFRCSELDASWFKNSVPGWELDLLKRLCTQDTASSAFSFLSFIVCLALIFYTWRTRKDTRSGGIV